MSGPVTSSCATRATYGQADAAGRASHGTARVAVQLTVKPAAELHPAGAIRHHTVFGFSIRRQSSSVGAGEAHPRPSERTGGCAFAHHTVLAVQLAAKLAAQLAVRPAAGNTLAVMHLKLRVISSCAAFSFWGLRTARLAVRTLRQWSCAGELVHLMVHELARTQKHRVHGL